jgi:hypothetical protein
VLGRAKCRETLRLGTPGPMTTAMAMRCERGVCVVSILLDVIFVKTYLARRWLDVPLSPSLDFVQIIFSTLIFFIRATFAFFTAILLEALAFRFFVAAIKASVTGIGHRV